MSVFDKVQAYSAKQNNFKQSTVFDTNTPEGAFLNRVHQEGYALYNILYKNSITEAVIESADYRVLSDDEKSRYEEIIEYTELYYALTACGNQLIESAAGSGKTTTLVFKIIHDIVTGEALHMVRVPSGMDVSMVNKMWVCTFLKTGAAELEKATAYWQKRLGYLQRNGQISFSTMDAEFQRCLKAMGAQVPIGKASDLSDMLKKSIDTLGIQREDGFPLSKEDYKIIETIVIYYRGRLDNSKYSHPSMKDYNITPSMLDILVESFATRRRLAGVMDFEEVMEMLYKYLYIEPNAAVQDFVANRYNFIYVDEFQDTSQMAYAILRFYARGKLWVNRDGRDHSNDGLGGLFTGEETYGKFVVIGDPSQCLLPNVAVTTDEGFTSVCALDNESRILSVVGANKNKFIAPDAVETSQYNGRIFYIVYEGCTTPLAVTEKHGVFISCKESDIHDGIVMYPEDDVKARVVINGCDYYTGSFESCAELWRSEYGDRGTLYAFIGQSPMIMKHADELAVGDRVAVWTGMNFIRRYITRIIPAGYQGTVYDINVGEYHNYIANDVLVHNCIYSFRGSDSKILTEYVDSDFRPVLSSLSCNWRCPENILNPIIPSIHKNQDSAQQKIFAANRGGEFLCLSFRTYKTMAEKLREDVMKDITDGYSVGILCRTNYDGMIPAVALEAYGGVDFGISGEQMTMNSPLPRSIIGVSSLFTERSSPSLKKALEMFLRRGASYQVKQVMDVMKLNNKSLWELDENDLEYSAPAVYDLVKNIKAIIMKNGVRDRSKDLEALKVCYYVLMETSFKGDSAYAEAARAYIEVLLFLIENNKYKTIYDFLEDIELISDRLVGRLNKTSAVVQIATVHEFKGKERESIIVWNDSDGIFPSRKCDLGSDEQVAEERRVHYIACTRAKNRERIYCVEGCESMFLREMDAKVTKYTPKISVSVGGGNKVSNFTEEVFQ